MGVVKAWDNEVRAVLPSDGLWFAPFSPETGGIDRSKTNVGKHRHSRARKALKAWLKRVGLPYHNPHNFRHGFAVYSIQQAKDISDLKAISMNLMHENLQVTDGVYGIFSNTDIQKKIAGLGRNESSIDQDEIVRVLEQMLVNAKRNQ
ncbi:MAG: hypothetical protein JXB38_17030 [Anaerolineales bacterium]|nr:hypothetical protein [Anaerolineales bacterium]